MKNKIALMWSRNMSANATKSLKRLGNQLSKADESLNATVGKADKKITKMLVEKQSIIDEQTTIKTLRDRVNSLLEGGD